MSVLDQRSIRHNYAQVGDLRLHYAESGGEKDQLVILVHGFPEFWYSWRHQMPVLGEHHHVVALDMRGYNLSSRPDGVEAYKMPLLIEDVRQVFGWHSAASVRDGNSDVTVTVFSADLDFPSLCMAQGVAHGTGTLGRRRSEVSITAPEAMPNAAPSATLPVPARG